MAGSKGFWNRGFLSLLSTQFLGAANDNILKQVVIFMVTTGGAWYLTVEQGGLGDGGQSIIFLCLTLPFIPLSGYAGQLADRFSKRDVMVMAKLVEVPIAVVAMISFLIGSLWLAMAALIALAIQSTFFGPAKYGIVPELVDDDQLSHANGTLNMLTNIAIIAGSLLAGPLSEMYDPQEGNAMGLSDGIRWAPGLALVVVSLTGLVSAWFMPKLPAADPGLRIDFNPFKTYWLALGEMATTPLLTVALAWSGFYMVGTIALLTLPEFRSILDITYSQTGLYLGILGVSIGLGSVITGLISGRTIRHGLVPFGALGMTICFGMLGILKPTVIGVGILIFLAGFSAGFYIIPLQSLLQKLSPEDERGRFLGTANALSFLFSSIGALIFWIATSKAGLEPNRAFLICAALALIGTTMGVVQMRRITKSREAAGIN